MIKDTTRGMIGLKKMITSVQNEQIKRLKKLHQRKGRTQTGTFIIEGEHLIEEAHAANWDIQTVVLREEIEAPQYIPNAHVIRVSEHVFASIAQTNSPQGILAVVAMKKDTFRPRSLTLMIDAVQDPGNIGTMIRTADAAGFDAVIVGKGSVDIYNDKVVRATQGSIFHIDVIQMDIAVAIEWLRANETKVIATALKGAVDSTKMAVQENMALIVGNEGAGVDQSFIDASDQIVKIPIYGQAESLNVSIAASILMYDMKRKIATL